MNITYCFEMNAKPGRNGLHSIMLRLTANRKHKRIKTPIAVKATEFDKDTKQEKWVRSKNPNAKEYNQILKETLEKARQIGARMFVEGSGSIELVVDQIQNPMPSGGWTIGAFANKIIADAVSQSVGYQRNLKSRLSRFIEFTGEQTPLSSINLETLNRFKRQLQSEGKMTGTQHTYFNRIKRLINEAIKLDLIDKDPFRHFEMPPEKPAPRLKLTDKQIQSLECIDTQNERVDAKGRTYQAGQWLERAKWMYLFAYQMGGIRSKDVLQLRFSNITGEPGNERLEYQMSKTGEFMSTRLTKKAKAIIDRFRGPYSQPIDYIFGGLSNQAPYVAYLTHEQKKKMPRELAIKLFNDISSAQSQINSELKVLAKKAGITDRLTFHTARHSYADRARRKMKESKNISIDDIRQSLGHKDLSTTQRYLNSFDRESLDSAMDAIFGDD